MSATPANEVWPTVKCVTCGALMEDHETYDMRCSCGELYSQHTPEPLHGAKRFCWNPECDCVDFEGHAFVEPTQ